MRARSSCGALAALLLLGLAAGPAAGQQVLLERGVRVEGVWCFPLASDTLTYLYLPDRARLATDEEGRPMFSFVRYVVNEAGPDDGRETITEAGGGGVLTFFVTYGVSEDRLRRVARGLERELDDRDVELAGPLLFQSGSYSLVSSILTGGEGGEERAVLATGSAPVLEGSRIALSFELEPERSTLLLESLQSATPDVSLVFDMTFVGIAPAFDAELIVDWGRVNRHKDFSAGGSVYWVGADVEVMVDEMMRNNAIQLRTTGEDEAMEGLLERVYDRLLTLLFEPVEPDEVPESERGDLLGALSKLAEPEALADLSRETTGFGLGVGYKAKTVRDSGRSVLNFSHRAALERHATIAFNIGDLYERWGDDPAFFRTVNLADPAFQQREIRVGVDGALLPELDRFVNSVTVTLRKEHEDGTVTLRELVLDGRTFEREQPDLRLVYGWSGDDDRSRWLRYSYRTHWSFRDGGSHDTGWVESDDSMIDLYVPYQRRRLELVGDPTLLERRNVRAVVVEVSYPFFGERRRQQEVVRTDRPLPGEGLEVTLPRDQFTYDYRLTWHRSGEEDLSASGTDDSGLIFIDEMPASAGAGS